jgi:streptomycin 6-kinase
VSPEGVPRPHPGLSWAAATEAGREWLQALPRLVEECARQWSLRLGEPFPYAYASLALPATLPDGGEAVLKICFPHRESEHEVDALAHWNGRGAVRLLAGDSDRRALLVERCLPGSSLRELAPDAALEVIAALLPGLWVPAGEPFRALADEAEWWASYLPQRWERAGQPFEQELLEAALEAMTELVPTQGEVVLVNQDLHAENVLRAEREPWLVIDPKPLLGEREFGLASVIRAPELGHSEKDVRHRLDRLTTELALDRERARGWALAQTLAWAWENDHALPRHVETARWLASARS